jgi:serine/threonine protein phosphatase PrpC
MVHGRSSGRVGEAPVKIEYWAGTDRGRERAHNEDAFLCDEALKIFIVADGMGGHEAGEVASSLCVASIRDTIAENRDLIEKLNADDASVDRSEILRILEHAVQASCSLIKERATEDPDKSGMGTTCSLLLLANRRGFIAHVGDSRIYVVRRDQVHQLSEDHSLANELTRRGKMKLEDLENSPYNGFASAVTRAVGIYENVEVDTFDFEVFPGDQFLLCTDGQHSYLDHETITRTIGQLDLQSTSRALIDIANQGGGHDNITNIVIRVARSKAEEVESREASRKIDLLKGICLFEDLDQEDLDRMLRTMEVQPCDDGQEIFRQGAEGPGLFVLLEGKARLHRDGAYLTTLHSGDTLGELSLVSHAPQSLTALAEGPTRVMLLRRQRFQDLVREEHPLALKVLWRFVQALAERQLGASMHLPLGMQTHLLDLTDEAEPG